MKTYKIIIYEDNTQSLVFDRITEKEINKIIVFIEKKPEKEKSKERGK